MADNYLQFSEIITHLTEAEEAWLKEQLQAICIFGDKEYAEDAVPAELAGTKKPDWKGIRFLRDAGGYDPEWDERGFECGFDDDTAKNGWGRHLWIYADNWGNPENAAHLVQKFLKTFRPDQCWSLTYAATCSRPRVGEFEGGAVFVTADGFQHQNAYAFIEEHREAFAARTKRTEAP